ncbi:hypothetical protein HNR60_002235 [Rhodopseudomonas rhenobacensis]|uniref:Uncharacterized protein n=1 Tax=Rhodopseudomonas rhenobacensis TaxID=87461 RepID=A0A7W8DZ36_9BRAD|nr:hypothetical protein [Rhodopseudomonas rhenobacensis]MBB5047480.1 hypothetical protein [Rhodopseudomonas rhenobacensis]
MKLKLALAALATIGGLALSSGAASAMPNGLPNAANALSGPAAQVDQVRYVCNAWGRCWWRPNYYSAYGYGPRFGGPRFYGPRMHRPWGYRHGWRRW